MDTRRNEPYNLPFVDLHRVKVFYGIWTMKVPPTPHHITERPVVYLLFEVAVKVVGNPFLQKLVGQEVLRSITKLALAISGER